MKVKELMKKLEMFDPEAEVLVSSKNFELNRTNVAVSLIYQSMEGSKQVKTFVNAFDHETYEKEIWSTFGGNLPVIYIS